MSGYEPYSNENCDHIDHRFPAGVNVIVGINGLGKTTLLNIVFRLLVGPWDPAKADRDRPGRKQAGLIRNNNFDFFRRRANDEAANATATATFLFGTRRLQITRSLRDLRLVSYSLDDHEALAAIDPIASDETLMDLLATLMGFDVHGARQRETESYRYDYDFVVRNLIFFLEDKVPLIWNPDGQFVILRILLVDETLSERIAKARNDLLQADSQFRNRLWASNKLREKISDQLSLLPEPTAEAEAFHLLVSKVKGLQQARDDLLSERAQHSDAIDRIENGLLRARAEAFDAQAALREEEAAFFQQAFRQVRSPGDLIMQALASHDGCLVCGSTAESTRERARRLVEEHRCPVCESDTSTPSEGVVEFGDAVLKRLRATENAADVVKRRVALLERSAEEETEKYRATNSALERTVSDLNQARRQEKSAEVAAEQEEEVRRLRGELDKIEEEVATLRADLKGRIELHEALIKESRVFIEARKNAIIEAFEEYASAFMVEDCRLRFRPDYRARVAQTDDPIDWPAFEVDLASGADAAPTRRDDWREVSESQKEFIDLAFRMALLRVASEGGSSMLAVETPEASLDAFFVGKAGNLLRSYANAEDGNVLLVSSNLTRERMIAQLLGTKEGAEDVEMRRGRTLNLLEYARPTKAYRMNKGFYDDQYALAIGSAPPAEPEAAGKEDEA